MKQADKNSQKTRKKVLEEKDLGQESVVPIGEIEPLPEQPRKYFDEDRLIALGESIKLKGQEEAVKVVRLKKPKGCIKYMLIDGERRYRAIIMIGLPTIKIIVRSVRDIRDHYERSLMANFNREDLTHAERVAAIRRMRDVGSSIDDIKTICGKTRTWVDNYVVLGQLHPSLLERLDPPAPEEERLSFAIALRLAKIISQDEQLEVFGLISEERGKGTSPVVVNEIVRRTITDGRYSRGRVGSTRAIRQRKPSDDKAIFLTKLPRVTALRMQLEDIPVQIIVDTCKDMGQTGLQQFLKNFSDCVGVLNRHIEIAQREMKKMVSASEI